MEKTVLLVAVNSKYIHTNPAVYYLQSYAAAQGRQIDIAEYTINEYTDDILADIYGRKPDVLMFSCYIWNISIVESLVRNIVKLLPAVDIYLGGPEVSYDIENVFQKLPEVKGIMVGEGEETLCEILDCYAENINISDMNIPGLYLPVKTAGRDFSYRKPIDMDKVPFPYSRIPEGRILYYESSRGCPFSCCYCLSSVDRHVRYKSLDKVYKELQIFIDNKVNQVKFVDRTFNCNEERTLAIWQYLIEHDNGITNFHFELAGDLLTDREIDLIGTMREGLIQLEIGIQSLNNETLGIVARHTDFAKLTEAVSRILNKGNIHVHLDLIAGLPKENYQSFQNSFNNVYKFHANQLQLGFLKVLKGSGMQQLCEEYGIKYREEPPYEVLCTADISYEELQKLKKVEEVLEIYHNSGQFIYSIRYLEHFIEDAFMMYMGIADIYSASAGKQSRLHRAEVLMKYAEKVLGETNTFAQILTFDMYIREKMKTRPEFAVLPPVPRKEQQEYISDFSREHAEHMTIDAVESALTGTRVEKDVIVVFDYGKRDISGNAAFKKA